MNDELMEEKASELLFTPSDHSAPQVEELIDMSAVFTEEPLDIPKYDPQMGFVEFCSAVESYPPQRVVARMTELDYPAWVVRNFEKLALDGNLKPKIERLKRIKEQRVKPSYRISKSRGVGGREAEQGVKGSGRTVFWRIPISPLSRVDKPRIYSKGAFRRWVLGEAFALSKTLAYKTCYVTGNLACETLYWYRGVPTASTGELLSRACVYVDNYKDLPGRQPPVITLASFLPQAKVEFRTLVVLGRTFVAPTSDLQNILGKKHSLFFALASAYFLGQPHNGKPVDGALLQAKLSTYFPAPPSVPPPQVVPLEMMPYDEYLPLRHTSRLMAHLLRDSGAVWTMPPHVRTFPQAFKKYLPPRQFELVWQRPPGLPFDVEPVVFQKRRPSRQMRAQARTDKETFVYQGATSSKLAADIGDNVALEFLKRHERDFASLAALFGALYVATTWKSRAAALLQYVASNEYLYKKLKLSLTVYQGDGDGEPGMDSPAEEGFFHGLARQVWEVAVSAASFICLKSVFEGFSDYFILPIRDFIKTDLKLTFLRSAALSISQSIIEAIKEVLARVTSCFKQKSFGPLWGPAWDPSVWTRYATSFISHQSVLVMTGDVSTSNEEALRDLRATGAIPSDWTCSVTVEEYMDRLDDHIDQGRKLIRYFRDSPSIRASIAKCIGLMEQHKTSQEVSRYAGMNRVKPFGLILYGKPGQGKTNLYQVLTRAIAERKSWDKSASGQYTWVVNANFQTGLRRQWCVVQNDVDHGVAAPQAGVDTHIQTFTKLVDNAPYPVEESESSLKGSTYASPMLVVYITNFLSCRASGNTAAPHAFWRRVGLHVEVSLKPEYAKADGTGDADKMLDSDTHDMYVIKVRHYAGSSGGDVPLTAPQEMTLPEFMVMFFDLFDKHLHHEELMKQRRSYEGEFCRVCYLPVDKQCGHVAVEFQGAAQSVPSGLEEEDAPIAVAEVEREASYADRLRLASWCRREAWRAQFASAQRIVDETVNKFTTSVFVKGAIVVTVLAACSVTVTKMYLQARENNSSGETPPTWQRASTAYKPGLPPNPSHSTFTKEQMTKAISSSFVTVQGPHYRTYGVAVAQNAILVPYHVLKNHDGTLGVEVDIGFRDVIRRTEVSHVTHRILPTCKELCVLIVRDLQLVGCLGPYPYPEWDLGVSQFDELELWGETQEQQASVNNVGSVNGNRCVTAQFPAGTVSGDCGKLYVARFGAAWRPVAMHYAMNSTVGMYGVTLTSIGGAFSQSDIRLVLQSLGTMYQGIATCKKFLTRASDYHFEQYPMVSEVDSARRNGATPVPVGTLYPPLAGGTMKTKVGKSLIHDDFFPLTSKWCGTSEPYWILPRFKGKMNEGKWESPYTNAFKTQNTCVPSNHLMWVALADYLSGISGLDRDGYRPLSEEETLSGLPGTAIHAFEVKTSVGPPYNRAKTHFMVLRPGDSYVDEEIWGCIDEAEGFIRDGDIPAAVGLCIPKDESLKVGKFPRIFINLPFAINFLLKQRFGAGVSFVRNNRYFFECMVGVNMTSLEANELVNHLARIDPTLERIADADAVAMDKSWSGTLWDFSSLAIWAIAYFLGLDAYDVLSLVLGLKHCRYVMKNDVFCILWNPSGNWITVLLNGLLVSLGERYIYYRNRPNLFSAAEVSSYVARFFTEPEWKDKRFTFRNDIALATYGDDAVKATRVDIPDNYLSLWHEELGLLVTDGMKTGTMVFGPLTDTTFLKRRFVFDAELGLYVARLSQKSMARTLLMKKESCLSMPDHAATAMSEVMREMVYYGEFAYERFRAMCDSVAQKHRILSNANFVSRPYAYWREQMVAGHYSAWSFNPQQAHHGPEWVPVRTGGRFSWVQVPGSDEIL